jgi:DNA-binding transcriptional MerR regulator
MADPSRSGSLPPKLYFRIGEVATLVGVEPHVLRYWEREFRSIRPTKSAKGQRVYSRRDVENLMRVRDLLYSEGFTIAGAKKKLHRSDSAGEGLAAAAPFGHAADGLAAAAPFGHAADGLAAAAPLGHAADAESQTHGQATEERGTAPQPVESSKAQTQLLAMREEIEAFLAELDGPRP